MVRELGLCLLLSGCSLFPEVPQPIKVPTRMPVVCNVQKPVQMTMLHVGLEVVQDVNGVWWVGTDGQAYANLAINNKEVQRYILDLQAYADALNDCISDNNKKGS